MSLSVLKAEEGFSFFLSYFLINGGIFQDLPNKVCEISINWQDWFISVDYTGAAESHQKAAQEKPNGDTPDFRGAGLGRQGQLFGLRPRRWRGSRKVKYFQLKLSKEPWLCEKFYLKYQRMFHWIIKVLGFLV